MSKTKHPNKSPQMMYSESYFLAELYNLEATSYGSHGDEFPVSKLEHVFNGAKQGRTYR